jgi:NitT/TauT family transport system ATP-binding protein
MTQVIDINGLSFSYTETQTLNNVTFSINKGEKVAIMGDSGKGKSTLLKLLSSYLPIPKGSEGNVKIISDNTLKDVSKNPSDDISYLPQDANKALFPWKNVRDNVFYPLFLRYEKLSKKNLSEFQKMLNEDTDTTEKNKITSNLQSVFNEQFKTLEKDIQFCNDCIKNFALSDKLKNYPLKLSGGERKRLSLIMALSFKPKVLLLDEPFSGIDFKLTEQLWKFLCCYFKENKTTVLLVTHSVAEAAVMADRVLFLNKDHKIAELPNENLKKYADMLSDEEKAMLNDPGKLLLNTHFVEYQKKIREEYEKKCTIS